MANTYLTQMSDGGSNYTGAVEYKKGSKSEDLKPIQYYLNKLGYYHGNNDGIYGDKMVAAVTKYQKAKGIIATGTLTVETLSRVVADASDKGYVYVKPSRVGSSENSGDMGGESSSSNYLYATDEDYNALVNGSAITFPGEYSAKEIQKILDTAYKKAPEAIRNRASRVKQIVLSSEEKMRLMYISQDSDKTIPLTGKSETVDISSSAPEPSKDNSSKNKVSEYRLDRWPEILEKGDKGDSVKYLQRALIYLKYSVGPKGADGIFGDATKAAVVKLQTKYGLTPDGRVGQKTRAALKKALS